MPVLRYPGAFCTTLFLPAGHDLPCQDESNRRRLRAPIQTAQHIYVSVAGIRQLTRRAVFIQHIPQDRVIGVTDDAVQCFPAPAVATVTRIDGIRIFTRDAAFAIIRRVIQQVFTGGGYTGYLPRTLNTQYLSV